MRGQDEQQSDVFSYVSPEQRVPKPPASDRIRLCPRQKMRQFVIIASRTPPTSSLH
jgi:hypothetical protein